MRGLPIKEWGGKIKTGKSHDFGVRVGKVYHDASVWLGSKRSSVSSRLKKAMKPYKRAKDEQKNEKPIYPGDYDDPYGPFGW